MSSLYILEIKPCWVALFANIFSQPTGCLFVLFMVSFVNNGIKATPVADMGARTECLLCTRHCSHTSGLSHVSPTPSAERELVGWEDVKAQHNQAGRGGLRVFGARRSQSQGNQCKVCGLGA